MKKTFLMQFEYFDDRNGITESFGTNLREMADLSLQAARLQKESPLNKGTAILLEMLESEQITGGQLMSLATLALKQVVVEAQIADLGDAVLDFLKRKYRLKGEEEEEL